MSRSFLYSSLNIALSGHWRLEEASGTRVDDGPFALSMTDNNSTTNAAGKIGNAGNFVHASNQYLSRASETNLVYAGDQTVCVWVNMATKTSTMGFVSKGAGAILGATTEYVLRYATTATDRFQFGARFSGGSAVAQADTFGSPSTSTWYFLCGIVDSANNTTKISVNAGAFNTASSSASRITGTLPLLIGSNENSSGTEITSSAMDGLIDAAMMWSRQLTQSEINKLYNSGNGRQIPNL